MRFFLFLLTLSLAGCDHTSVDYFPLTEGNYWQYAMTYRTMDGNFKGIYSIENLSEEIDGDQRFYIRKILNDTLLYYRKDENGILLDHRVKRKDLQTEVIQEGRYVFRYPLEKGNEWNDTTVSRVLIKTGPPQITEFHIVADIDVKVKIESMTDMVKVPAGTFRNCMRISYAGSSFTNAGNYVGRTIVKVKGTDWYAPGIGLVKTVREETTPHQALDKGAMTLELETYRS